MSYAVLCKAYRHEIGGQPVGQKRSIRSKILALVIRQNGFRTGGTMGDLMRPLSLKELLLRSFSELKAKDTIFDIPRELFRLEPRTPRTRLLSTECGIPIGPAAGPHTQLAQNILASYLSGGRYIELKTVQILDELSIEKPCIDARDEGYNVEWSTEFTLEQAYDEYLKAWFLLHVFDFAADFAGAPSGGSRHYRPSFLFNMSVGYDLKGIKSEKMDLYIRRMIDSSDEPLFINYSHHGLEAAAAAAVGTSFEAGIEALVSREYNVSPAICSSVTLSTMHGCPPGEIEAICEYLMIEKGLDTLVKLNPTLLGYARVRDILDRLGYGYVKIKREGFEHDLQYADAVPMLKRLGKIAADSGRFFGVKLTNTLAVVNNAGVLPGDDMYLSGRTLYPITINLAAKLAAEFGGKLPMSISGGVSSWNVKELLDAGIKPVTVATEILKPGGYGRLKGMIETAEETAGSWSRPGIDVKALEKAASDSLTAAFVGKEYRGEGEVSISGPLPMFDCFVAPCVVTCPIAQDVPEYIHLVGEGRYEEAFSVIYDRNPLPFMTGYLCDHACEANCTRLDWEGSVKIREAKRIAAECGYDNFRANHSLPDRKVPRRGIKAAVIGAGPAGLAAASFLAREGFDVHLYEREAGPGGVVGHVIPGFRIPQRTVERDVSLLEDLGVVFHFGVEAQFQVAELKAEGFSYVLAAIGAEAGRETGLSGAIDALEFLRKFRKQPVDIGPYVAVIGAGDTAMDAARAALRCRGVKKAHILYRRSEKEMPASQEEYEAAVSEGVEFRFLVNPAGWAGEGVLECELMKLGEVDASGRARPVPTGKSERIEIDTVISAVGEVVDETALRSFGITGPGGDPDDGVFVIGDASTGAANIVKAIASASKAAKEIISREGGAGFAKTETGVERRTPLRERRDRIYTKTPDTDEEIAVHESRRCLGCRALCLKCVEVCPNRANTALPVPGRTDDFQIVHLDAFCNECGNCETFCPWDGSPYRDKFTVFSSEEDFRSSTNPGFHVHEGLGAVRCADGVHPISLISRRDGKERIEQSDNISDDVKKIVETIVNEYRYLLGPVEIGI